MKRINHALVEGSAKPDCLRQSNPKDHQGHADGRGGETAARSAGGGSGETLCRAHGQGFGQSCRLDRDGRASAAVCSPAEAAIIHLLVVCTAERGLCGAFNSSIARLARDTAISLMGQGKTVKILCVGKKGHDVLRRQFGRQIIEMIDLRAVRSLGFDDADAIGRKIVALHAGERVRRLHDIFLALPVGDRANSDGAANHSACFAGGREGTRHPAAAYEYEPDEEEILATLLPRNISIQVLRALLENAASEQGARMSAMDNASRNAGEMIKKQTMKYNRSRQAMITKELIEIISGAEAL